MGQLNLKLTPTIPLSVSHIHNVLCFEFATVEPLQSGHPRDRRKCPDYYSEVS